MLRFLKVSEYMTQNEIQIRLPFAFGSIVNFAEAQFSCLFFHCFVERVLHACFLKHGYMYNISRRIF